MALTKKRSLKVAIAAALAALTLVGCAEEPKCWEDEVRVIVYSDQYNLVGVGTVGCVPADNLPVDGYRP